MRAAVAVLAALVAAPSMAQQVIQAQAMLQPTIYQDDGGYNGCGLRVVMGSSAGSEEFAGSDFSVNLFLNPVVHGTIKVAGMTCTPPCDATTYKAFPVESFRLSAEDDGVPVKILRTMQGDPPEFSFSTVTEEDATRMMTALVTGKRVQLGLVPKGSPHRRVYSFTSIIEPGDHRSFVACLEGMYKRAETDIADE